MDINDGSSEDDEEEVERVRKQKRHNNGGDSNHEIGEGAHVRCCFQGKENKNEHVMGNKITVIIINLTSAAHYS